MSKKHKRTKNKMNWPVLMLNGNGKPLSNWPLSLNPMKKVLKSLLKNRVIVVKEYEDTINVKGEEMNLPKIVILKEYININNHKPKFSRQNVYLRDDYTCQYCGHKFKAVDLTFDHVVPRCKGGTTNWENIATACRRCNSLKGGKTLGESHMKLIREPFIPSAKHLEEMSAKNKPLFGENDWNSMAYWTGELEEG